MDADSPPMRFHDVPGDVKPETQAIGRRKSRASLETLEDLFLELQCDPRPVVVDPEGDFPA